MLPIVARVDLSPAMDISSETDDRVTAAPKAS